MQSLPTSAAAMQEQSAGGSAGKARIPSKGSSRSQLEQSIPREPLEAIFSARIDSINHKYDSPMPRAVTALYVWIACAYVAILLWTQSQRPLGDVDLQDTQWMQEWLYAAIANYFASAICLCGIIIATHRPAAAWAWTLCILTLGCPFAFLYMVQVYRWYGGFALKSRVVRQARVAASPPSKEATIAFAYILLGTAYIVLLVWLLLQLKGPATEASDWIRTALFLVVANLYGVLLCFGSIVRYSQSAGVSFLIWVCLLLVGAPGACVFMAYRCIKYGTLELAEMAEGGVSPFVARSPSPPATQLGVKDGGQKLDRQVSNISTAASTRSPTLRSAPSTLRSSKSSLGSGLGGPESPDRATPASRAGSKESSSSSRSQTPNQLPVSKELSRSSSRASSPHHSHRLAANSRILVNPQLARSNSRSAPGIDAV